MKLSNLCESILNEEKIEKWSDLKKKEDPNHKHHYRYECVKCGNVQTCRCRAPKTTIEGICEVCTGEHDSEGNPKEELKESYRDKVKIEITCTEAAALDSLLPLIEYIKRNGAPGHSFGIVVEPDETIENGKRSFGFDGDGADVIYEIKMNDKIYEPSKGVETKLRKG